MKLSFTQVILFLGLVVASSSFCPDGQYLHSNEIAGSACFREDEEEILCDSNDDKLCTETNCLVQRGGWDEYTCGHAEHYYDPYGYGEDLLEFWTDKCCYTENAPYVGCLAGKELSFKGECTYEKVVKAAAEKDAEGKGGCSESELFSYLAVGNSSMAAIKVEELCATATNDAHDSFLKFSDIASAGYQFDREFMNGGSSWNNEFNPDLSRIQRVIDNKKGISFPEKLYNFKLGADGNCASNAVMCCWTSDSSDAGDGSCTDSAGCQDAEPVDNTDVCYVNITDSPLASHTKEGMVAYPGDSEGNVNCRGFTWTDDDSSGLYKGNMLFEVAMRYGLMDNGYTRSVPHAPMCACVEQMPVVSKSDCVGVEPTHIWSFAPDADSGLLNLWQSGVDLAYNDCGGKDLAAYYADIHKKSISHRITGECASAEKSFFAKQGYVTESGVEWVKVAGKGSFAEPKNTMHTEQLLGGTHTSYSRSDFEALWAKSTQVLMRHCKYCKSTHRYTYLKRNDQNGLPPNVDLLKIVKDEWKQYENNTAKVDFNLYSTFDDALQEKMPWKTINSDYYDIGFARDSGPDGYVYDQWNVWDKPLHNKHYGQRSVAFYVAMPASK